jgi:hypothetical protein
VAIAARNRGELRQRRPLFFLDGDAIRHSSVPPLPGEVPAEQGEGATLNALIHERGADEILFVSNNRAAEPVSADDDEAVARSVREWVGHMAAGRIGRP